MSHEEEKTEKKSTVPEATSKIIKILKPLDTDEKKRVLAAIGALFES